MGERKALKKNVKAAGEAVFQSEVIVLGQHHAALVPVVELMTRLSPSNVRLMGNVVRCVLAEQDKKA